MSVVTTSDKDLDNDDVQVISIDGSRYKRDIRLSAMDYMASFFHDKTLQSGAPIPNHILYSEDNISLVINTRMASRGIDLFYEVFEDEIDVRDDKDAPLPADVSFLMAVHRECAHRRIPKQYASGIAVIYLRLCANLPRKMKASA